MLICCSIFAVQESDNEKMVVVVRTIEIPFGNYPYNLLQAITIYTIE